MAKNKKNTKPKNYDCLACCFQGGGALGAYQVGVLEALQEGGYDPHWFAGTSIGAINSAIAAGNAPKDRIHKLREFWDTIATPPLMDESLLPNDEVSRRIQHFYSSQMSILFGQPGFFRPRIPWWPAYSLETGNAYYPDVLSYYDTSPLRRTLERLVDFDRINAQEVRLSVGAVEISTGKMRYFDNEHQKIGPEHVMASGALPPGFPPVEVEGKYYWDGGLSSNTAIAYVLKDKKPKNLLCFMVHLFDSYGLLPETMDDVYKRKKDIIFCSRFDKVMGLYHEIHRLRYLIHQMAEHIPEARRAEPQVKKYLESGWEKTATLVRFLYEGDTDDLSSKDYEFSKKSIAEHITQGYEDGKKGIHKPLWNSSVPADIGVAFFDMTSDKSFASGESTDWFEI